MDEGAKPGDPFPEGSHAQLEEPKAEQPELPAVVVQDKVESVPVVNSETEEVAAIVPVKVPVAAPASSAPVMGSFLSQESKPSRFGVWKLAAVIAAIVLIVGAVGLPWGWYARSKGAKLPAQPQPAPAENSQAVNLPAPTTAATEAPATSESSAPATANDAASLAAKRAHDARARLKAQETAVLPATPQTTPANATSTVAKPQVSPVASGRKATVQVSYDENGRVTQASGGDATALRIARQKRFPVGKPGSATVTIPIN